MSEVSDDVKESLRLIEDLKFFLATAPANWQENQVIRRYYLNNDEGFVSCVFWNNLYFITGTDIVRCILYKFQHFGRTITDRKKFEEGIFSDLRNLKAGEDAVLENPKLAFLDFLYKNSCLRTQKKQKVFYWFNVPHDKLMADALERDIKKENAGHPPTSVALREPALLFHYEEDKSKSLYDQLSHHLALPRFDSDIKPQPADDVNSPDYKPLGGAGDLDHDANDDNDANLEDDDFPLDYLDKGPTSDFITLDPNFQSGSYINAYDNNFDSIDPVMFQNPVSVANNDDYFIEQTVPARGPNSSTLLLLPRLARIVEDPHLSYQTGFVPTSGHYPTSAMVALFLPMVAQFPASSMMALFPASSMVAQFPTSAMVAQFSQPVGEPAYYVNDGAMYAHSGMEPDMYQQMPQMAPMPSIVHFEPPPFAQQYGYYEDYDYGPRHGGPSHKQREISASMSRKRQQLQQKRGIIKPERPANRAPELEARLRDQLKPKSGQKSEETLILTPESAIATDQTQPHN